MTAVAEPTHVDSPTDCRVSFRQPVMRGGAVDGAWWPRSDELTTEIVPLLEVLATAGREMRRVSYHLGSWQPAPRRIVVEGQRIHLGGYRYQNEHVISLSDVRHNDTVDLLVIAADTEPALAERLMTLASETDNLHTVHQLLELAAS